MCVNGKWKTIRLHRFILDAPPELAVDHINGNPLDNRRSNIRLATEQQNKFNQKQRTESHTKYKGVYTRGDGRWSAAITVNQKRHQLGTFGTQYDAAIAYNNAARKLHGEFAKLNELPAQPDPDDKERPLLRPANGAKKSKYRNVVWTNERQCWIARLTINGKPKFLGRFTNELDAAKAVEDFLKSIEK